VTTVPALFQQTVASIGSDVTLNSATAAGIRRRVRALLGLPEQTKGDDGVHPVLGGAVAELVDQVIVDAHGVTDEQTSAVASHLGEPGLVAVMSAIATYRAEAVVELIGVDA
jgi:hypothetical protein